MKVKDFSTGLFILLAVGAMLTSCKKEVEDCNCGTVIDSRKSDVYVHIDITIEDECSGNEFKVTTPRSTSGKYPRGSYYCNK